MLLKLRAKFNSRRCKIYLKVVEATTSWVQSCKLYIKKYMIASTQITNTINKHNLITIFAFIPVPFFKLLSRKVLFINRKDVFAFCWYILWIIPNLSFVERFAFYESQALENYVNFLNSGFVSNNAYMLWYPNTDINKEDPKVYWIDFFLE